jgi:hypothetical protein
MTPINIAVPESLTKRKQELESTPTTILAEEEKLVAKRRGIQAALAIIASSVAILSCELVPTATRKPMAEDAKLRIAEGLREAKAKAAEGVASAPQTPAPVPAKVLVADAAREPGSARKGARE